MATDLTGSVRPAVPTLAVMVRRATIQRHERWPTERCAVVGERPVAIRRAEATGDPTLISRPRSATTGQ
jgi:hypothetical protein